MSTSKVKKNKRAVSRSSSRASSSLTVLNSLLDCYNFLSPNEYSERTFGVLAFLLRKSVDTINFSDIIDEAKKRNQEGQSVDFVALLEDRRKNLPENDASIEKCLMLNRLIIYIQENEKHFSSILSHIRLDMKKSIMDHQLNRDIQYPEDFHRREADFLKRKKAQDMRRLFYFSHDEAEEPPNLIHLQNRTTEHLSHLIDSKMGNFSKSRDIGVKELEKIFANSFMIIKHPCNGVNPVLIYERKGPGIYTAKVSVIIVSLLYDFMETRPNIIKLYDIEPTLLPLSNLHKRDESQKLAWKTCHLQACQGNKPQIIQYAELSFITIKQTYESDIRVHFAQVLHTLKFTIKLQVNLAEYRFLKTCQITLESLPFAIGQYSSQIPQLLTRVILDDIRRFSIPQSITIGKILYFLLRYFIHRTGVEPHEDHKIYLEQELIKALNARKNFQTLEDIFMDFLVQYVHQVEFMAKHPILAMFYADGIFLGICDSALAAEAMKKSSDMNLPIVGLRFNSIKIDYNAISEISTLTKKINIDQCAIRVDIYNNRRKTIRYRTFDSSVLSNDLSNFVYKAFSENLSHIRILCNSDNETNDKTYKSFAEFSKYYHARLHELSRNEEKYKLITDLVRNFDHNDSGDSLFYDGDDDDNSQNTDLSDQPSFTSDEISSAVMATLNDEYSSETVCVHDYIPMSSDRSNIDEASSQSVRLLSKHQEQLQFVNNQEIVQYVLSQPEMVTQLVCQFNELNLISPAVAPQQQHFSQFQSFKIETSDNETLIQTKQELPVTETSADYFESSSSSLHPVRLRKTPTNSLIVESTPVCCTELVGLTLKTTHEYDNNQNISMYTTKLKQNIDILIIYLGVHPPSSTESKNTISQNIKIFKDEFSCISELLSTERQAIYFIISATLGRIVIPLIHNHICIEHIYIQRDDGISQNCTWIDGYSKILGTWSSIQEIEEQVEQDSLSLGVRPTCWSRTPDIFGELWAQKSSITIVPDITDDIKQIYAVPVIVTLCGVYPPPFVLHNGGIKIYEFSAVEDCRQFVEEKEISTVFLVIIGDYNDVFNELQLFVKYNSIHALYVFPINNSNDKYCESILVCKSPKISGVFYQEKDLLLQMVADICFFRQIPTHIPEMNVLEIEFDILSSLTENKKAFLNFQFLIDILKQLWCAPGVPSKISDCIEIAAIGLSSDLFMNNIQLTLEIDRLIKQFDSDTLIKASSRLRLINQHLESSVQKIYPFSMTIYRAQLVSDKELTAIKENKNNLFTIHTFALASRSFSSTKNICRRAYNNGLNAVLLEINIPKKTPLTYLDSDIIIFPLPTVFKIVSTVEAPDKICHIQIELADSTMDLITEQLYYTIGEHLTWLTYGNYLAQIKKFDAAENYFKYLEIILSDSPECASIYNNMSLMYLSMSGKDQEALYYLKKAQDLIKPNKVEAEHTEKHSDNNDEANQYEKLAELHEQEGDYIYARLFYEKALKYTSDSPLRKIYQLKIETLNRKKN